MTVYLDLVMLLNFLVDFSLLLGTNRLSGYPPGIGRCLLAAVFGGLYSGICLFPEFRFLGNSLWRMVSLALMALLAFGFHISVLQRTGVFVILSMALGGLALSFGKGSLAPVLLCSGILWLLCILGFPEPHGAGSYEQVAIRHEGKTVRMLALRDTGNTLRDPVTGEPVMVVSGQIAQKLTGLTEAQLRAPVETMTRRALPGLRLIPFRSIGGGGLLLAARFPEVTIGNRTGAAIVAFAAEGLGNGEIYQALTGGTL